MKLDIFLKPSDKTRVFRPGEQVCGALDIKEHVFKEIPAVTATFRGQIKTVNRPQSNKPAEHRLHILFEESQKLVVASKAFTEPCYSAPFRFKFPSSSSRCSCQLPPSLRKASTYIRIRVDYSIIVTLRYRSFCKVRRTKTVRQALFFRSESIVTGLESSTVGCLPANMLFPKTRQKLSGVDGIYSADRDWLPPYTPSLQLEVSLTSPPVMEINQTTPIRLIFHTPPELLEGSALYLRCIVVKLRSSVDVFVGTLPCELVETTHCWSSRGLVRINDKRFELDSGSWGGCVIAEALPTCSSCLIELKHAIEVTAGISKDDDLETQYVNASLGVLVMDPPPTYNAR